MKPAIPPATARWRKSSYSNDTSMCVEVGAGPAVIAVRDSKDPDGPMLTFSDAAWRALLTTLTAPGH